MSAKPTSRNTWPYPDELGVTQFWRRRVALDPADGGRTKKFIYIDARGGYGLPKEFADLIYRLPETVRAVRRGETIWWTEGEKDADTLVTLGLEATSHHGGAGHVSPAQARWLLGAVEVVVCADYDAPGYADALLRRRLLVDVAGVPRDRVRVVRANSTRLGSDVTDHVRHGFDLDALVDVPLDVLRRVASTVTRSSYRRAGYRPPGAA